ncbi:methyltransferase [Canibacter zhoujuaniae]|uniref:methyltransferase n=1 Tax=Canibacter zhoujuaniae TaxID=2708343 RepID=UPI001424827F|nr:methyltransferase [Canibacter zhoujuaniae]
MSAALTLSPAQVTALRAALDSADYTLDSVTALLGAEALESLRAGSFAGALHRFAKLPASPLKTLCALFYLGAPVTRDELQTTFTQLTPEELTGAGVLRANNSYFSAAVSLNPVTIADGHNRDSGAYSWWLFSDLDDHLRKEAVSDDHVMGVGGATRSLISQLPPLKVATAADIGTGCGVVAFHLAKRAAKVVATDLSSRTLNFAQVNAQLNEIVNIEFRAGDLFAPLGAERFDLLASNPPFVINPAGESALSYRSTQEPGDALVARFTKQLPGYLNNEGRAVALLSWENYWGKNFADRPTAWLEQSVKQFGSAWVIERDRVNPLAYAKMWARDGGVQLGTAASEKLQRSYLDDFEKREVSTVSFGSLHLQNGGQKPVLHVAEVRSPYGDPQKLGSAIDAAFRTGSRITGLSDSEILESRLMLAAGVKEQRLHKPGEADPQEIWFAATLPFLQQYPAGTATAAMLGASDGELSVGQIAGALADIFEVEPEALATELCTVVRELAYTGLFTVAP